MKDLKRKIKGHAKTVRRSSIQLQKNMAKHKKNFDKTRALLTSDNVGKTIEKNIGRSHSIRDNLSIVLFSMKSLVNLSHFSRYSWAIIFLIISAFILVFPTKTADLEVGPMIFNFVIGIVLLFASTALVYLLMKFGRSKTKFKPFFFVVNISLALSLLIVSVPILVVAFAIFSITIKSDMAIQMFLQLIPFYNYLVWGWSCEKMSQFKGVKAIAFGLICLLLVFFLHLALQNLLL